jgi:hypothetical protein
LAKRHLAIAVQLEPAADCAAKSSADSVSERVRLRNVCHSNEQARAAVDHVTIRIDRHHRRAKTIAQVVVGLGWCDLADEAGTVDVASVLVVDDDRRAGGDAQVKVTVLLLKVRDSRRPSPR